MTHLEQHRWETPPDYFGHNPVGEFCFLTVNRDSDALTRSNWNVAECDLTAMGAFTQDDDGESPVYIWRASHWAVGWVDYMMIKPDAPVDVLAYAERQLERLQDYPILDESDYSALEWKEASDAWEQAGISGRLDILKWSKSSASPFCARRPWLPEDDGEVYEYLRD